MGTKQTTGRDLVPGFAEMVKNKRKTANLTLREVATAAGISVNSVASIESGVRSPSLRVAAALARALGIDTALADPVGEKTKNERPHATH